MTRQEKEAFVSRFRITHALLPYPDYGNEYQRVYIVPIELGMDSLVSSSALTMGVLKLVDPPS